MSDQHFPFGLLLIAAEKPAPFPARPRMRALRSGNGFTLVEVLAAAVLMSIGLTAILAANQVARQSQSRAICLAKGRNIAQNKIEELRFASIDSIPSSIPDTSDASLPQGNSVRTSVAPYPDSSSTDLYKVSCTVTWPEGASTRKVCYETLISRK